ncbi:MAG: phytanoyl-CoA dioxygenase family protein [Acidimicrobiaceae bacterium]|nr:phytanoyl-CoA dioxygenase family protein [Acidimicrobiaceae bacterium]MYC42302.1 phytanoyl-CoA dioxygenase family protein [Acidimicrobiaceae bacterium]
MTIGPSMHANAVDSYRSDGFFILAGFSSPDVGQNMLEDVIDIVRDPHEVVSKSPGMLIVSEAQKDLTGVNPEDTISKVFTLHTRPAFTSFLNDNRIAALLVDLIGPDADCFLSQFIFKNPGAWGQPWHQDGFYFPFDPPRTIVGLWLAVTEATLQNGCLHILAGSHTEPIHTHIPDRRPEANHGYMEIVDHDMSGQQPVLMNAGDLLVFDSHLMHCSIDNLSSGIRAAMVFHCCAADTIDLGFEQYNNFKSPTHQFMPLLRDGRLMLAP